MTILDICTWFAGTCDSLRNAQEPSDFIKAFAHPIALDELPDDVTPTALQLDSMLVNDLLEDGATLMRGGQQLDDPAIEALRGLIRELWMVEPNRTREDQDEGRWRLKIGDMEVGQLVVRSTKISFISDLLRDVTVIWQDRPTENLNQLFNGGNQPLRLTFSDTSYAYASGQLFRDHRLLASRAALLDVLSDRLDPDAEIEKEENNGSFSQHCLFGAVVHDRRYSDDYLVCDDIGTEWADFIRVSRTTRELIFYHCKGGRTDVGASDLHEVVSQAVKNLGYLSATRAELNVRSKKWRKNWNGRPVPRLQRGANVDDVVNAFVDVVNAPQAVRRVVLITSALSKAAVADAFERMDVALPAPEVCHVLWLLSVFVDQCRAVGVIPEIVCRP